tara:strand:- start:1895 stop:2443 length:549 start_codon:yes stop_codon:yes gene_type:complete
VLRPGGLALFYAWAMEQSDGVSGHSFASQDVFVPFHQRAHTAAKAKQPKQPKQSKEGKGGGGGDSGGGELAGPEPAAAAAAAASQPAAAAAAAASQATEAAAPAVHQRYCHVYREHELRQLAEGVPGAIVVQEYYDTGNHCLLLRKAEDTKQAAAASLGEDGEPLRCSDGSTPATSAGEGVG